MPSLILALVLSGAMEIQFEDGSIRTLTCPGNIGVDVFSQPIRLACVFVDTFKDGFADSFESPPPEDGPPA